MFLLDRDGEAAGTFSRHSPEWREGESTQKTPKMGKKMDKEMAAGVHLVFEMIVWLVEDYDLLLLTSSFSDSLCLKSSK